MNQTPITDRPELLTDRQRQVLTEVFEAIAKARCENKNKFGDALVDLLEDNNFIVGRDWKEFGFQIDFIAWRTSFAQPVAIAFQEGFTDDVENLMYELRICTRNEKTKLLKVVIALNRPDEIIEPYDLDGVFIYGCSGQQAKPAKPVQTASEDNELPF